MYNSHRGMVPAPNSRLTELLDQVRAEFDNQAGRTGEYEHQIATQMNEMEMVRQKVYQLEQTQIAIKNKYDEDLTRLQRELEVRGGPAMPSHAAGPPHNAGPAHPAPPSIGHGPSNLFGGIMTGQQGQGGPGLAPPPPQEQQPQPPPPHQIPQPPPVQQGPPQPPQAPYQGYQPAPAVNGGSGRHGPATGADVVRLPGYASQPPQAPGSPGAGKGRSNRAPLGPPTLQQNQAVPYHDPRGSPQVARPTPPPQHQIGNVGNTLADLDFDRLPSHQKKEGNDWFAVFNPRVQRVLDVDLVHTLPHDSVVCCVRFSSDGKYVATGCNRTAQIFEVGTGKQVSHLEDNTVDKEGDLYIRSVCFSPDGRYLATGAEDKQIRVWDIASRMIKHIFSGHEQDIYSLDFSRTGRLIASGSGDRTVRLWNVETRQHVMTLQIEDGVTTVAISPDGHYVAAGSLDKSVRVWDTANGDLVERLEGPEGHKDSVYSVAFAPNGRDLVSGSLDKTIKMWELTPPGRGPVPRPGKCIRTFEGHKVSAEGRVARVRRLTERRRTLCSASPSPPTVSGCSAGPRTEACSSGIHAPAACS
ncbi:MAG: general transcription repressor [Thelocarpon impressellum]|nr:MAG: general transcription repressor [Thelocarpon impressellum]